MEVFGSWILRRRWSEHPKRTTLAGYAATIESSNLRGPHHPQKPLLTLRSNGFQLTQTPSETAWKTLRNCSEPLPRWYSRFTQGLKNLGRQVENHLNRFPHPKGPEASDAKSLQDSLNSFQGKMSRNNKPKIKASRWFPVGKTCQATRPLTSEQCTNIWTAEKHLHIRKRQYWMNMTRMTKYHWRWPLHCLVQLVKWRCRQMEDPMLYLVTTLTTWLQGHLCSDCRELPKWPSMQLYAIVTYPLDEHSEKHFGRVHYPVCSSKKKHVEDTLEKANSTASNYNLQRGLTGDHWASISTDTSGPSHWRTDRLAAFSSVVCGR